MLYLTHHEKKNGVGGGCPPFLKIKTTPYKEMVDKKGD
jgi:hypothetical protein